MPGRRHLALAIASLALLCVFAASAQAASYQRPLIGTLGSAEQPSFRIPRAIVVDPTSGDVLVGEEGASEEQQLTVSATAGSFKLSFEGNTTEDIPFDVNDETLKEILAAAFGPGIGIFGETREGPTGETVGKSPFRITFGGGAFADRDVEQLGCEDGSTPLSGGSGCSVTTTADGKALGLYRFHPDGAPAPFGALGSNAINGMAGPGGLPCAEEPASCDQTPQNEIAISFPGSGSTQISVDPTTGNIYLTQIAFNELGGTPRSANAVDIFSPEGKYLGQLTQAGAKFSNPCGVAVDSAGTVYVAQNRKISVFVPSANPPVNADNVANFSTRGYESPCRMALGAGPSAGSIFIESGGQYPGPRILKVDKQTGELSEFVVGDAGEVEVDPTSGNPIVFESGTQGSVGGRKGIARFAEFDGSLDSTSSVLSRMMVEAPGLGGVQDIAADASGDVYVAYSRLGRPPTSIRIYGQPVIAPTVLLSPASDITSSGATLSGSVNSEGIAVTDCSFEWGRSNVEEHTISCEGSIPPDFADHPVQASISDLISNGAQYKFRLAAKNENGVTEYTDVKTLATGSASETKPATVTGPDTATLNGLVHPEEHQYEECSFEWGIATNPGYEHTTSCTPEAGAIPPDSGAHPVSAELSGLSEGTVYRFRLVAKNNGALQEGSELSFETFGRPRIEALRASDASQGAATLEAQIDPRGFQTSYRFEWGPTDSYGHFAPASFEPVGEDPGQVRVSAPVSGLATATSYHYRVVAKSDAGEVQSADQTLETLNSCGLPDGRCLELLSPREPGVALPLERIAGFQPPFQAAEAPGKLAYETELGFPGATSGGETVYVGSRGTGGWESTQYNPDFAGPGQGGGVRYSILALSPNLECGVVSSRLPLTSDPVAKQIIEAGGANLYRRNPDGSYTLITDRPPDELKGFGEIDNEFALVGMSDDCGRIVFASRHHYPGVAGTGDSRLYEWDEGELRNVGWVPSGSGEALAEAQGGFGADIHNAVSEDGSRVFFTATSKTGSDSGKQAVFVRIDGAETLDVSQSPLAADTGATFQGATPDGSRVYFTANAGLSAETNSAGRDLYECQIVEGGGGPECELTDLSVSPEAGGVAEAGGSTGSQIGALVGVADDGSRVYFIARGQLVPGKGRSLAGNEEAGAYSLYGYEAASGSLEYVGEVDEVSSVTTGEKRSYSSRTSADGRYLLFESRRNLTGYDSGGIPMAYFYDAEAAGGEGSLACLSCPQDGKPTLDPDPLIAAGVRLLAGGSKSSTYRAQSLVVRNGKPHVFFLSMDGLATGGVRGEWGLYEWAHGQVFNIASDLPGGTVPGGKGIISFLGASADGTDAYFADPAPLNWENPDARRSVWDARIGGGFPEPSSPVACDPTAEGSCQGGGAPAPSSSSPGSASFSGPGNAEAKQHRKKHRKRHSRGHHKKKHHKHRHKGHHKKKGHKKQRAHRKGARR